MPVEEQVSGYCSNCEEFGSVYYDFITEKYWCKKCLKVSKNDFTVQNFA